MKIKIEWTAQFAYALGLLASDGCLSKDGRHIDLTSKDVEQLENFMKCVGIQATIGEKQGSNRLTYYRVQFSSIEFY